MTKIVLTIPLFSFISFCFIYSKYFAVLLNSACVFKICLLCGSFFYHCVIVLGNSSYEIYFIQNLPSHSCFILIKVCIIYIFHHFTFNLPILLYLKPVSCRKHKDRLHFFFSLLISVFQMVYLEHLHLI